MGELPDYPCRLLLHPVRAQRWQGDRSRYTDPQTTFQSYLNLYVTQARAANGISVFLTPSTRRSFTDEHTLKLDDLQNYAQAMRDFAASNNLPVLDVLPASIDFYEFIGKTKTPYYQAEVRCRGILVQAALPASGSVYFQGSFDLTNWQAYGKTNAYPASTVRSFPSRRAEGVLSRADELKSARDAWKAPTTKQGRHPAKPMASATNASSPLNSLRSIIQNSHFLEEP